MERAQLVDRASSASGEPDGPSFRTSVLSRSERDVLADAAEGLTMLESAARRFTSTSTVKSQRHSIIQKLGARNIAHAVAMMGCDRRLAAGAAPTVELGA